MAKGLYPFDVNDVEYSKCNVVNNVSTGTACNEVPNVALPNLSIEENSVMSLAKMERRMSEILTKH